MKSPSPGRPPHQARHTPLLVLSFTGCWICERVTPLGYHGWKQSKGRSAAGWRAHRAQPAGAQASRSLELLRQVGRGVPGGSGLGAAGRWNCPPKGCLHACQQWGWVTRHPAPHAAPSCTCSPTSSRLASAAAECSTRLLGAQLVGVAALLLAAVDRAGVQAGVAPVARRRAGGQGHGRVSVARSGQCESGAVQRRWSARRRRVVQQRATRRCGGWVGGAVREGRCLSEE